jgi:hypothetical protein
VYTATLVVFDQSLPRQAFHHVGIERADRQHLQLYQVMTVEEFAREAQRANGVLRLYRAPGWAGEWYNAGALVHRED